MKFVMLLSIHLSVEKRHVFPSSGISFVISSQYLTMHYIHYTVCHINKKDPAVISKLKWNFYPNMVAMGTGISYTNEHAIRVGV